eukprot:scaffold944_cov333-Pavlova_lutheri.AAC.22
MGVAPARIHPRCAGAVRSPRQRRVGPPIPNVRHPSPFPGLFPNDPVHGLADSTVFLGFLCASTMDPHIHIHIHIHIHVHIHIHIHIHIHVQSNPVGGSDTCASPTRRRTRAALRAPRPSWFAKGGGARRPRVRVGSEREGTDGEDAPRWTTDGDVVKAHASRCTWRGGARCAPCTSSAVRIASACWRASLD